MGVRHRDRRGGHRHTDRGDIHYTMGDEVDLEELMAALSAEELANLVDEMAADPDDKHMPASVRTAYRCEKEATGELNRDSLINCINEIALNTPDKEEKVKLNLASRGGRCMYLFITRISKLRWIRMKKDKSAWIQRWRRL